MKMKLRTVFIGVLESFSLIMSFILSIFRIKPPYPPEKNLESKDSSEGVKENSLEPLNP